MEFDYVNKKLERAVAEYNAGRYRESSSILKDVIRQANEDTTRFKASRELAVLIAKEGGERNATKHLTLGTSENREFQKYINLAIDLYPSMPSAIQNAHSVATLKEMKSFFDGQSSSSRSAAIPSRPRNESGIGEAVSTGAGIALVGAVLGGVIGARWHC